MSRNVVITGASAGVGRAVAVAYARRGARVALIARGRAGLEGASLEVRAAGAADVRTYRADVADAAALQDAADDVAAAWGGIDVWVNDAMASVFAPAWDISPAEYRRVTEVNYLGTVHGTLAALRHMRPAGRGAVVQIGSALAYRGIPLQAPYCASKHAIQGFNDSLRAELLHDGDRVKLSMVQLPAVNTPQFSWVRTRLPHHPQPVPPIYQPEVVARAVLWVADRGKREINVGGPTLKTRLGNIVAPAFLDRLLSTDKRGYQSQQTGEPVDPATWQDNVDKPVDDDRDFGAHGVFDAQSRSRSFALWATMHKPLVTGVVGAGLGLVTAGVLRRR
ncbi:SDR family oxidoreductase [Couchioplanes caeruleus]|uniref:Short-chain dehydrogenase n=2 Tax=Couchioplanes caeruleus TaxID=56438 RepID=A0A1K0FG70_9ACTN|nr:SDR family oxidoreductase [Couchioplanes caeruleus]OJF11833.1 short-chain dehydrogenase [Couchioplanes caeruleus subsp. caeruleus]ROP33209.1 short-subunit dehydrogenase [Couchioplanes caeruleus]